VIEVFLGFLRLGLTSFGGPIAHLGYFRRSLVEQKGWVSEAVYADLVALAQFLPGPASSQVGFSLGVLRAGFWGGLAAWTGFTLPSAALLLGFAYLQPVVGDTPMGRAVVHGLKLVAVAVVAQAVLGMARTLCPDRRRASIALAAVLAVLFLPTAIAQIATIIGGAVAGLAFCRNVVEAVPEVGTGRSAPKGLTPICLGLFVLLFLPGSLLFHDNGAFALFHGFYKTGALVFGGGHVVLPLLREQVVAPGWVSEGQFLSGYGAAQAVPGPLFTLAAYLGAVSNVGGGSYVGAAIALIAIFLPGLLLMLALSPHWRWLRRRPLARSAMHGINAAVVGILAVALYDPVWTSAVHSHADFGIAAVGFVLLTALNAPPLLVVAVSVLGAIISR
jgi:chromate transporter